MQLYALDSQGRLVHAMQAAKGVDYRCAECDGAIRLRGGVIFRRHFWHIQGGSCRQNGKGIDHLAMQQWLLQQLPDGQAEMERPFSTIGRIADIAWAEKRLVIEVQCSQMSAEEAICRTKDYEKAGWQLIWMLDRRRYKGFGMTELEAALQKQPHYYFELTRTRKIALYDLLQRKDGSLLEMALKSFSSLFQVDRIEIDSLWPERFKMRLAQWPIHLEGDFITQYHSEGRQQLFRELVLNSDDLILPTTFSSKTRRLARLFMQHLLEKYCR